MPQTLQEIKEHREDRENAQLKHNRKEWQKVISKEQSAIQGYLGEIEFIEQEAIKKVNLLKNEINDARKNIAEANKNMAEISLELENQLED